ncbi:MAG: RNA-binding protein [Verrucomicrobiae bacterium]|nr:RNA-binding protein [Verrucomicrobiae bacterium]
MKLYIGNLSYDTGEAELREALTEFEPIMEIYFPMDRESGRPRGFAFVTLADREKGEAAMEALDGKEIAGRRLKVNEAEDRRQGGGAPRRSPMEDPMELETSRKDDRPTLKDGTKVRYKGI